ncbi:roadblock/LC7 domain-containing protein [Streptomyces rapamycinicus]|uniref:Dynein regulation protein LC7 n=2 Tax=Streptomyces rapamycinicus TaxID=1226757 RepID=A0A3L8R8Q4_STRRN|nr:roadblock/LC7 domain-containing protein [Streptomyces rapamycinicus]MBB4780063.1 putative regulator of Ras-like GTPase activity (Roadblock/LC7/MglB family) [Streptomyces rapamycinicus]RLV75282.1 dynein regulation protein LC7 [Streptomyces rapamycinicus NRRL 5491]UTO67791.1 roadblock/LC7 domain-containing protein [Streptomyces rapamycinicus]UTP28766.1 roadblock/LC7 domain-containing protein [Streptomyces rapamycinicus NRRL 5491]
MTKPRSTAARPMADLDRILDDLVAGTAGVRHAVVLSRDGATVSASAGLSRHEAEHLAAVASGFHGIAASAGRRGRGGPSRRTMIEMTAGTLFVVALADGACLAVLGAAGADPAVIAEETARLVDLVDRGRGSWSRRRFGRMRRGTRSPRKIVPTTTAKGCGDASGDLAGPT